MAGEVVGEAPVTKICSALDLSRAGYYKHQKQLEKKRSDTTELHHLVLSLKCMMPKLGGKKTYNEIKDQLVDQGLRMGRDKFFVWLKENNLLVERRRKYAVTTNSKHPFRIYKNLIQETKATAPDQIWVSDITYLRIKKKKFCYLALITDAYSRKIVGYNVNNTLELEGSLQALKMAVKARKNKNTIHHSDRGVQYCSKRYTAQLKKSKIQISMAAAGNCYENALAERVNGILKSEFYLDAMFNDLSAARKAVEQSIYIYNHHRPHLALNYSKPYEVYAA